MFVIKLDFFIAAQIAHVVQLMLFKWSRQLGSLCSDKEIQPQSPAHSFKAQQRIQEQDDTIITVK